eukprot:3572788-Pyramimonas_sp.AAC.1
MGIVSSAGSICAGVEVPLPDQVLSVRKKDPRTSCRCRGAIVKKFRGAMLDPVDEVCALGDRLFLEVVNRQEQMLGARGSSARIPSPLEKTLSYMIDLCANNVALDNSAGDREPLPPMRRHDMSCSLVIHKRRPCR